jgi:hypothetical protein
VTFLLYYFKYLGFNIYGFCGNSFVRRPNSSIAVPIAFIIKNLFFLGAGFTTIAYYKRHYPDSKGFRSKRKQ